jgi:hypothetical protein
MNEEELAIEEANLMKMYQTMKTFAEEIKSVGLDKQQRHELKTKGKAMKLEFAARSAVAVARRNELDAAKKGESGSNKCLIFFMFN